VIRRGPCAADYLGPRGRDRGRVEDLRSPAAMCQHGWPRSDSPMLARTLSLSRPPSYGFSVGRGSRPPPPPPCRSRTTQRRNPDAIARVQKFVFRWATASDGVGNAWIGSRSPPSSTRRRVAETAMELGIELLSSAQMRASPGHVLALLGRQVSERAPLEGAVLRQRRLSSRRSTGTLMNSPGTPGPPRWSLSGPLARSSARWAGSARAPAAPRAGLPA